VKVPKVGTVLWCGVLQCSGLASREFVSDVTARGRGASFRVSGRF
jgi:hypothetical protein